MGIPLLEYEEHGTAIRPATARELHKELGELVPDVAAKIQRHIQPPISRIKRKLKINEAGGGVSVRSPIPKRKNIRKIYELIGRRWQKAIQKLMHGSECIHITGEGRPLTERAHRAFCAEALETYGAFIKVAICFPEGDVVGYMDVLKWISRSWRRIRSVDKIWSLFFIGLDAVELFALDKQPLREFSVCESLDDVILLQPHSPLTLPKRVWLIRNRDLSNALLKVARGIITQSKRIRSEPFAKILYLITSKTSAEIVRQVYFKEQVTLKELHSLSGDAAQCVEILQAFDYLTPEVANPLSVGLTLSGTEYYYSLSSPSLMNAIAMIAQNPSFWHEGRVANLSRDTTSELLQAFKKLVGPLSGMGLHDIHPNLQKEVRHGEWLDLSRRTFREQQQEFRSRHPGQYVAIAGPDVLDFGETPFELFQKYRKLGKGIEIFYICSDVFPQIDDLTIPAYPDIG